MSAINTSGIDVNYPIPGQNNSTQGFRDNFAYVKNNLNIAAAEITDLQNKAVLKTALTGTTIDNDMGNTLIANASTLQFRSTMYNLGNALVDVVLVNCSLGDVHYGNLAGNIFLNFGSWIPTNTLGGVELRLGRPDTNTNYTITLPNQAVFSDNYGWSTVENSYTANALTTITFPHNITQLILKVTSTDCGNTLYVQPINRSFRSTQIQTRTPPSTGQVGDAVGTVCVDPGAMQLTITSANIYPNGDPFFTTASTSTLTPGLPVIFSGVSLEPNVYVGNTYYIGDVLSDTTFNLVRTADGNIGNIVYVNSNSAGNTMQMNPVQYMYIAVDDYSANSSANPINVVSTTGPNLITLISNTNVAVNGPIMFTGSSANLSNVGLAADKVYYVKNMTVNNITLSEFRYNGLAGLEYQGIITNASPSVDCVAYKGPDIFRRISLTPF